MAWTTGDTGRRRLNIITEMFFVARSVGRSTKYKTSTPMVNVYTRYSKIIADVTGNIGHRTQSEEDLSSLGKCEGGQRDVGRDV